MNYINYFKMKTFVLGVGLIYITWTSAQVITVGKKCPNVTTASSFDVKQYLGVWYEIVKFKSSFEEGQLCNTANYTLKSNGHIQIVNTGYASYIIKTNAHIQYVSKTYAMFKENPIETIGGVDYTEMTLYENGKKVTAMADGYAPDPNVPGRLAIKFNSVAPYAPYWILNTDYQTYTLIYSCEHIVIGKIEFAWILSRKRTLDEDIRNKLYTDLSKYGVVTDNFMEEDQSNCPQKLRK